MIIYNFDFYEDLDLTIDGRIALQVIPGKDAPVCSNPSHPCYAIPPEPGQTDYDIFLSVNGLEVKLSDVVAEELFNLIQNKIAKKVKQENRQKRIEEQVTKNILRLGGVS